MNDKSTSQSIKMAADSELTMEYPDIELQASMWFSRLRSDNYSKKDFEAYIAWMNESDINKQAYQEVVELWSTMEKFAEKPEIQQFRHQALGEFYTDRSPVDEAELSRLDTASLPHMGSVNRLFPNWVSFAIAASILLAVVGMNISTGDIWNDSIYKTEVGEQKSVELTDGSTLVLDTQTEVQVQFSHNERKVYLHRGQAHFEVYTDKSRPFIVEAGNGLVEALGTAFVIKKQTDQIFVTLIEGNVAVSHEDRLSLDSRKGELNTQVSFSAVVDEQNETAFKPDALQSKTQRALRPSSQGIEHGPDKNTVYLEAGQQVSYTISTISQVSAVDLEKATSWQKGRLIFEGNTMMDVVKELNRYSKSQIIIADERLKNIKITGVFKTGDNQRVVQALKAYFSMRVSSDRYGNLVLTSATSVSPLVIPSARSTGSASSGNASTLTVTEKL